MMQVQKERMTLIKMRTMRQPRPIQAPLKGQRQSPLKTARLQAFRMMIKLLMKRLKAFRTLI